MPNECKMIDDQNIKNGSSLVEELWQELRLTSGIFFNAFITIYLGKPQNCTFCNT